MLDIYDIFSNWRQASNTINAKFNGIPVRLEVLKTIEEQQLGFMFRPEPDDGFGLFFVYEAPQQLSFWMRNVGHDLDLIALDTSLSVMGVRSLKAGDERSVKVLKPCQYILELRHGWCKRHDVSVGSKLELLDETCDDFDAGNI